MPDLTTPIDAPSSTGLAAGEAGDSVVIPVVEETLALTTRRLTTGSVRVSTRTMASDEVAEVAVDRNVVEVNRVPVDRIVEVAPDVRVEGDTTVIPVVEERLVVVKQLVLVEEVHVRRRVEQTIVREPVSLRRQHVVVERIDAEGRLIGDEGPDTCKPTP